MRQDIKLTASDGFHFGCYRADPSGLPKGGIMVVREIFGVNPLPEVHQSPQYLDETLR